jgi:Protein of unknown function (DUF3078)/Protein of unknown function, DUF481
MRIKNLFIITALSTASIVNAQTDAAGTAATVGTLPTAPAKAATSDTLWRKGATFNLNLNQTALSNWAGGGSNSVAVNGLLSMYANYAKGLSKWDNTLDLAYGLSKIGETGNFTKTDDRIELNSKYGRKLKGDWYYGGLVNFRTQFNLGYNAGDNINYISKFMAPGYLTIALGFDYKPNDNFSFFIAPIAYKLTVVGDKVLADRGEYGVDLGERTRSEIGGYARLMYQKKLMENVDFKTKVDAFSNYQNNPQNIDVTWETLLSMKVNKYISASLSTMLIYDDDIDIILEPISTTNPTEQKGPRVQFKEVLNIGFAYIF